MSMKLGNELRTLIWSENDWPVVAHKIADEWIEKGTESSDDAAFLVQLASLCEFAVLDPQVAADLYVAAFNVDRSQIHLLPRVRDLCLAVGNMDMVAQVAENEYHETQEPGYLAIAGQAWLDAGEPERALKPLWAAESASPKNPHLLAALWVPVPTTAEGSCIDMGNFEGLDRRHWLETAPNHRDRGHRESCYEQRPHRALYSPCVPSAALSLATRDDGDRG